MQSVIVCKKNDETVFEGRALDDGSDFYNTHTWTCESCLAYLKDTVQPPYSYKGTLRGLLESFVTVHNEAVEDKKKFAVGNVTVTDDNDYISYSNSKYRKVIRQCNHKFDGDHHCSTPHLTDDNIQRAFLSAANKLLATKDLVIADGREMMSLLFDTTDMEREQAALQQEAQIVSDMVQQCIYENAHVALDQTEYQKRYDGLTERFEKAKARLDMVTAEIYQMQTQRASIEDFLKAFAAMPDELTEFTLES